MKTFIIYYHGGQEPIQAYGEYEAKNIFKRINPGVKIENVVTYVR